MKQLLAGLLATFVTLSLWGQNVTLQFENTKKRSYQAVIDDTSYSLADAASSGATKMVAISHLSSGTHTLAIYPSGEPVTAGNILYSNNFQLREGYDLNIVVKADGTVSFTEKRHTHTAVSSGTYNAEVGMRSADFKRLAQSVRTKWLQAARVNAVREAFTTTENRFTTEQIAKLLSYINSEPTRLDLMKAGYVRVVDPANYKNLSALFSSETLRTELDFFLQNTTIHPAEAVKPVADSSAVKRDTATDVMRTNAPVISEAITSKDEAEPAVDAVNKSISKEQDQPGKEVNVSGATAMGFGSRQPVSDRTIKKLARRVRNQRTQQEKVAVLSQALNNKGAYFTTTQLRQLITPVTGETSRLKLAKLAYARTADTANFSTLYSLLDDRYHQMELDHFVRYGTGAASEPVNTAYAHRVAINDANFARLDLKVHFHLRQPATVAEIRKAFSGKNYFTAEQIYQWLSLVTAEADRLELAKLAYLRITDPGQFNRLYDLFADKEKQEALAQYVAANKF